MFGSILIFVSGLGGTIGSTAEKRVLGLVGEVGEVEEVLVEVGAKSEMGVSVLTAVVGLRSGSIGEVSSDDTFNDSVKNLGGERALLAVVLLAKLKLGGSGKAALLLLPEVLGVGSVAPRHSLDVLYQLNEGESPELEGENGSNGNVFSPSNSFNSQGVSTQRQEWIIAARAPSEELYNAWFTIQRSM